MAFLHPLVRDRRGPLLITLLSFLVVGGAFASQYWVGLNPCKLCWYQRIPYGITIVLGLTAAALAERYSRAAAFISLLCAVAFASGATVAAFHVGVEQGWWTGSTACVGVGRGIARTADELRALLETAPIVRCNEVQWSLFGVSMAGYNVMVSIALTAFALLTSRSLGRVQGHAQDRT